MVILSILSSILSILEGPVVSPDVMDIEVFFSVDEGWEQNEWELINAFTGEREILVKPPTNTDTFDGTEWMSRVGGDRIELE